MVSAIASSDLPNFTIQWTTSDGVALTIRAIRPCDLAIERAFLDGLSLATSYKRLLSGRKPTDAEVDRWTHANRVDEFALVAIDHETGADAIFGVTRYVREAGDQAEFAIVLADAWQARGLGRKLLSTLIEVATSVDVAVIYGITLADNLAMLGLMKALGFIVGGEPGDATLRRATLRLKRN